MGLVAKLTLALLASAPRPPRSRRRTAQRLALNDPLKEYRMPRITLAFAAGLIVLGIGSWLAAGQSSVTALIPSFFGIALAVAGLFALEEGWRKRAMHAAAAVALLGALGSLGRAIPSLDFSEPLRLAVITQLVMGVAMIVFLVLCVRSFIQARRSGIA